MIHWGWLIAAFLAGMALGDYLHEDDEPADGDDWDDPI